MNVETINQLNILNPKRKTGNNHNFYPYYAGFSQTFANTIIESSKLPNESQIIDPWNGSGTTTTAAANLGHTAIGFDLNPVMMIAARANLLDYSERSSVWSLTLEICKKTRNNNYVCPEIENDLLALWLTPSSAAYFRKTEKAIQSLLVNNTKFNLLLNSEIDSISCIASFFYVALFKTLRNILSVYNTSNPTWIKFPDNLNNRLRPSLNTIVSIFKEQVESMLSDWDKNTAPITSNASIKIGSSTKLDLSNGSIDYMLTSPPYCTRIDYAVATMPELAILGYSDLKFDELRKGLIGTLTVPKQIPAINPKWGHSCTDLLEKIYNHSSKASKTYYYKNHVQYFDSMFQSFSEISRVLKTNGSAIIVVQDSHYKNVYNDLALICSEMAEANELSLIRKENFSITQSMAGVNAGTKKYRSSSNATESVLCFIKE